MRSVSVSAEVGHAGPWTVADVLALADDGPHTRHELLDGTLIVSPAPSVRHQRASRKLANLLHDAADHAGADVEVLEAVNVELPSGLAIPDVVIADALVASTSETTIPASAVRCAVEIISASSRRIDRLVKPGIYAEAGINSYLLVDLDPSPTVTVFALDGEHYRRVAEAVGVAPARLPLPFPFTVAPANLLAPHTVR